MLYDQIQTLYWYSLSMEIFYRILKNSDNVEFILYGKRNIKFTKYKNRHQENYVHHFINSEA